MRHGREAVQQGAGVSMTVICSHAVQLERLGDERLCVAGLQQYAVREALGNGEGRRIPSKGTAET